MNIERFVTKSQEWDVSDLRQFYVRHVFQRLSRAMQAANAMIPPADVTMLVLSQPGVKCRLMDREIHMFANLMNLGN